MQHFVDFCEISSESNLSTYNKISILNEIL